MHTIPLLNQGIGLEYITLHFIRNRLVKLWGTRKRGELQYEKFLPTMGLKPTISCLLDWRSNILQKNFKVLP